MQSLVQDVRYALRQLIKRPAFTLTALISLALGIGAATAVFSVIYSALIAPYPYRAPDRLVRLTIDSKAGLGDWVDLNGPQIQGLRQLPIIESILAMEYNALILTGQDVPENVNVISLTSNGFNDLGVPPALGRGLLPSDALDGQAPQRVVVLGYKFWQKHFLSAPDVLGKILQLDRKNYVIVGVAAPRFAWYSADVYLPLQLTHEPGPMFMISLRLKHGVAYDAADTILQPMLEQFARDMPKHFPEHFKVHVQGLNERFGKSIRGTLYLLFGAVMMLLTVGCGNLSILLLARGTAREQELAVRVALGARRYQVARQLLTESLLLATIGAALGILTAQGILAGIQTLVPRYTFAPEVVVRINLPVLLFSIGVALVTGVLFGLGPALQLSRTRVGQVIQSNTRLVAGSIRGRGTHNMLVSSQIALTMLLLAGAGSAMQGFVRLLQTPLGYDPYHVMSVGIPLRQNSYTTWDARAAYFEQLRTKVADVPGVSMTAISTNATPPRSGLNSRFEVLGQPALEEQMASIHLVSPGYFSALRIPLMLGRVWNETENHNGALVVVINQTLAQRYFPKGDAIGHSVKLSGIENRPPAILSAPNIADSWLLIMGVVGDVRNDGLTNPVKPAVFVPYTISMGEETSILVRSEGSPLALLHSIRKQLAAVNPEQQTYSVVDELDSWVADEPAWRQEHLAAWIFGLFAGLALALATVGLYSVVSYTVLQRTKEFGIRIALGAGRLHVLRVVFVPTLKNVAAGIVAGTVLVMLLRTVLHKWIQDDFTDPFVILMGAALLSLISAIACAIPARQASHADPVIALRFE